MTINENADPDVVSDMLFAFKRQYLIDLSLDILKEYHSSCEIKFNGK